MSSKAAGERNPKISHDPKGDANRFMMDRRTGSENIKLQYRVAPPESYLCLGISRSIYT